MKKHEKERFPFQKRSFSFLRKTEGISLSEMNTLLLKKVEELTLYAISIDDFNVNCYLCTRNEITFSR